MQGIEVGIDEILNCREKRVVIQNEMIRKYKKPVISFTMNIPGPIKTNNEIKKAFDIGKNLILEKLKENNIEILEIQELNENTGNELFISVDSQAEKIKNITVAIEESSELGRLFDIDVIDVNFEKLSRKSFRKCLICEEQAQECGRSRKHSVEELQNKVEEILTEKSIVKAFFKFIIFLILIDIIILHVTDNNKRASFIIITNLTLILIFGISCLINFFIDTYKNSGSKKQKIIECFITILDHLNKKIKYWEKNYLKISLFYTFSSGFIWVLPLPFNENAIGELTVLLGILEGALSEKTKIKVFFNILWISILYILIILSGSFITYEPLDKWAAFINKNKFEKFFLQPTNFIFSLLRAFFLVLLFIKTFKIIYFFITEKCYKEKHNDKC